MRATKNKTSDISSHHFPDKPAINSIYDGLPETEKFSIRKTTRRPWKSQLSLFSQIANSSWNDCLLADSRTWNKYTASGARPPMITCLVASSAVKVGHFLSGWPPFSQYVITRPTPESPFWKDHSILTEVLFSRLIFTSGWPTSGSNSQT